MYKLVIKKSVTKFLEKRPPNELKRIIQKFEKLKENPYPTNPDIDSKKMANGCYYRLRIGRYRFLYVVDENSIIITIEKGDSRGDIYK